MSLESQILSSLSKDVNAPVVSLRRIMGSQRVFQKDLMAIDPELAQTRFVELGMRVIKQEGVLHKSLGLRGKEGTSRALAKLVRDYQRTCPIVYGWVVRGDFKADKVPDMIGWAALRHANATAARLRAAFLQGR